MKNIVNKNIIIIFVLSFLFICGFTNVSAADEVLLVQEQGLQFVRDDRGFLSVVTEVDPNDHGPNNWISPVDYWNGQFQVRYVIEGVGDDVGKLQTCIWTRKDKDGDGDIDGWYPETCSGQISYSKVGDVEYNDKVYPNGNENGLGPGWYRKEGTIDYSEPEHLRVRVVLRGPSGCNVMPYAGSNVCGKTSSNTYAQAYADTFPTYENLKFGLTIVLVPSGQEFSGWENYPVNGQTPTPISDPTPTATPDVTPSLEPSPIDPKFDLDDDGIVDIRDVLEMIKYLFK